MSVAAWLAIALLVEAQEPPTPYERLVKLYAAGDRAPALAQLRGWSEPRGDGGAMAARTEDASGRTPSSPWWG